jgi:DNA-binding beta-propeller fold protein YncE
VSAVAALLVAAGALAFFGCNRTEHTRNQAPRTMQSAPPTTTAAGYVYITNNGEGTVSEFSRQADGSLNLLRAAKTGAVNGPTGIVIDPTSRFLYVANEGDGRIYQFSIKRDTGDLAMVGEGSVDDGAASRPQQIAISPRGDFVYVTNSGKGSEGKSSDGSIAEYSIDSATGALKPLDTFRGGGLQRPLGIAITPNGKFAYVSDSGAGTIVAFAIEPSGKLQLVGSVPSLGDKPGRPGLVAIHPSGSFVYTVDTLLGIVVAAKPAEDGKLSVTKTYHVGISTSGPFGIALAGVGPNVFVYTGNRGSDTVSTLTVKPDASLEIAGECPTGLGYPTGMVVDPGKHNLYVVSRDASTVSQFQIAENDGVALYPAASIFTGEAPSETSHPLYIATTAWDASAPATPASATPTPAASTSAAPTSAAPIPQPTN